MMKKLILVLFLLLVTVGTSVGQITILTAQKFVSDTNNTKNTIISATGRKDSSVSIWSFTPGKRQEWKLYDYKGKLIHILDSIGNYTIGSSYPYGNDTVRNPPKILFQHDINDTNSVPMGVGSLGYGEVQIWGNFKYDKGIHQKYKQGLSTWAWTMNRFGVSYQFIPSNTYDTDTHPDVWERAGAPVPFFVDTAGRMTLYNKIKVLYRTSTDNSTIYDDTTTHGLWIGSGKIYFKNKVGIGTETPSSKLHVIQDGGLIGTNYSSNSGFILENKDARAQIELKSTTSSYILFGDQTTPNKAYIGYTNSTTNLDLYASGNIVLNVVPKFAGTNITGSGTALLGTNSPAITNSEPYTWIRVITSDGSTGYMPVWK